MDKKVFGSFLRQKRQGSGKSLEFCAGQLDISSVTLRRWEDGLYAPRNYDQYRKIARVYGLSKVELFKHTGISIADTLEEAGEETDLLPLLKQIAKTKLPHLNQACLNHLIRAFCKSNGTDFDSQTIEILIKFKD